MPEADKLKLGKEYTMREIGEIFNYPDLENYHHGSKFLEGKILLFLRLDKTEYGKLPETFPNNKEEAQAHVYDYFDCFDVNKYEFYWEPPLNDHDDIYGKFKSNNFPCHLFVTEYYQRDGKTKNELVYCGRIRYKNEAMRRRGKIFIAHMYDVAPEPSESLKKLYEWRPENYPRIKKEFKERERLAKEDLDKLIYAEEFSHLERKSSLRGTNMKKGEMVQECVGTIASFLNSTGGNLVIGVTDNKKVIGIEGGFGYKDKETWENDLVNVLKQQGLSEWKHYIHIYFHLTPNGKTICEVHCMPLNGKPLTTENAHDDGMRIAYVKSRIFIREGPSKREIPVEDILRILKTK